MSCREKGSSVSRSRKFLALIFSCSTAYSQGKPPVTVPVPNLALGACSLPRRWHCSSTEE